ncbi:MAG: LURP-one-related/scramblase family protein [Candidatus Heimdallarchaeaceae archaeon]|jgi:uncharacterized protein YxjI
MAQAALPYGFRVRQKIFAFRLAATYDIFDEATQQKVFIAKKKFLAILPTIVVENLNGQEVAKVKSNFWKTKWKITQNGKLVGMVKFPFIRVCGIKFSVEMAGNVYHASDLLGWKFSAVDMQGRMGFYLDKRILTIRDTYKVDVYPPLEPVFGLAAALAVDVRFYQGRS